MSEGEDKILRDRNPPKLTAQWLSDPNVHKVLSDALSNPSMTSALLAQIASNAIGTIKGTSFQYWLSKNFGAFSKGGRGRLRAYLHANPVFPIEKEIAQSRSLARSPLYVIRAANMFQQLLRRVDLYVKSTGSDETTMYAGFRISWQPTSPENGSTNAVQCINFTFDPRNSNLDPNVLRAAFGMLDLELKEVNTLDSKLRAILIRRGIRRLQTRKVSSKGDDILIRDVTVLTDKEIKDFGDALVALMPRLRAFAISLCGNPHRADDLTQETLLKAWSHAGSFELGTNLRAWVFTILRNTYFTERNKHKREILMGGSEDFNKAREAIAANVIPQNSHSDMQDFRKALNMIPSEQREGLILTGAAGMTIEEAADAIGCPEGTVKSRVNRAREKLMEILGIKSPDDFRTSDHDFSNSGQKSPK